MIMKQIYLSLLIILTSTGILNAQVKIGNTDLPEKFSILELDALKAGESATTGRIIGGLRLPQWEDAKAVSMIPVLTAKSPSSDGLLIYNKDKSYIQMWNGTTWVPLPQKGCTSVQTLVLSANQTTFSEYGPTDLVLTATPDANVSGNADIVYRWTLNSNPIGGATGNTYTVKKENLIAKYAGTYKVTAYSCAYTGTIQEVSSNTVTISIPATTYSLSVNTTTVNIDANVSIPPVFTVTTQNTKATGILVTDDPEHMYSDLYSIQQNSPTEYEIGLTISNTYSRSPRTIKFKIIDKMGNETAECSIIQAAYIPTANDKHIGDYFLYETGVTKNAIDAVNFCRSITWSPPKRTSLMSMDFLTENKSSLEADPTVISAGSYWVLNAGIPVMVNVSYPGGVLTLTPQSGEPETNIHTARCIAPY